jgi:transposase
LGGSCGISAPFDHDDDRTATAVGLTKVIAGEVKVAEAAGLLGLSVRSVWRLKRRFADEGPAGLVHGNRGRASPRRIDESTREQVRTR